MTDTIKSVTAVINGQTLTLTYNSTSGKYEASGVAPAASSFNLTGGYYPVSVTAKYMTDESTTVNDQTSGAIGQGCRFVVRERVIPTVHITYPTPGQYITTAEAQKITLQLRDNETQTTGFSGIDLSTFALTFAGQTLHSSDFTVTAVTGGYNLEYVPSTPVADGPYTITASVKDNDENTSATASVAFVIDTAPPQLSVTSPVESFATASSTVPVAGVTTDAGGLPVTVKVKLNGTEAGTATVQSDGSFSFSLHLLEEGDQVIMITATDSSGKISTVTRNIYYSTAVPVIESVELIPNPADGGATYVIKVDVS